MFLEISQNSQESACARVSFFNKVAGLRPPTLLKKALVQMFFPVNFPVKFLRTPFYKTSLHNCFSAVYVWKTLFLGNMDRFYLNRFYLNTKSYSEINSLCSNGLYINYDINTISLNEYCLHRLLKWTTRKVKGGWKALTNDFR